MIKWRNIKTEQPEDGQYCLTIMKHGMISGSYSSSDKSFNGYNYRNNEWYFTTYWVPTEEINNPDD